MALNSCELHDVHSEKPAVLTGGGGEATGGGGEAAGGGGEAAGGGDTTYTLSYQTLTMGCVYQNRQMRACAPIRSQSMMHTRIVVHISILDVC